MILKIFENFPGKHATPQVLPAQFPETINEARNRNRNANDAKTKAMGLKIS